VQQSGICGSLVEREERDVGDPGEAIQSAPDLPACVEAQGAGTQTIDDDANRCLTGHPPKLRMVSDEAADSERVCGGERDDLIRFRERRGGRRMTAWSGQIVGGLVVGIEGARYIDDRFLRPCPAHAECGLESIFRQFRPPTRTIDAAEDLEVPRPCLDGGGETGELRDVERAEFGSAAGGGDPRFVVAQPEQESHGRRDRVRIDERGSSARSDEFDSELDGEGRPPGRT
jgi:hypothetical protein